MPTVGHGHPATSRVVVFDISSDVERVPGSGSLTNDCTRHLFDE